VGDHAGILGAVVFFKRDIVDIYFHASSIPEHAGVNHNNLSIIRKRGSLRAGGSLYVGLPNQPVKMKLGLHVQYVQYRPTSYKLSVVSCIVGILK
jgi:hypothetical protein